MGTYADYFNAQYQGPVASGPVRLTIGRSQGGDAEGHEETWVEEELMDQVEGEAPAQRPAAAPTRPTTAPLLPFATTHSMVWVLDTYVYRTHVATFCCVSCEMCSISLTCSLQRPCIARRLCISLYPTRYWKSSTE